ncbi:MAG: hypothetical protein RLZZ528_2018 [Pseudomonadota bacterium]
MNYESSADIIAAVQAALNLDGASPASAPVPSASAKPGPRSDFWTLPGICWNARVATSFGDLPVQGLRRRDPVRTPTGGLSTVAFVDEVKLDAGFLDSFPDAQPITIQPGALGNGRPTMPVTLSPHQRIAVGEARFASDMRMARDLLGRPGVTRSPAENVRYYIFHCGEPTSVMVEGVWIATAP